jgi:uncharacterized protein YfaS (alpha-2-macroglobulin family)
MQILAQEINKRSRAEWVVTNPLPAGFDVVPQTASGDVRGVVRMYLDEVSPPPTQSVCVTQAQTIPGVNPPGTPKLD